MPHITVVIRNDYPEREYTQASGSAKHLNTERVKVKK